MLGFFCVYGIKKIVFEGVVFKRLSLFGWYFDLVFDDLLFDSFDFGDLGSGQQGFVVLVYCVGDVVVFEVEVVFVGFEFVVFDFVDQGVYCVVYLFDYVGQVVVEGCGVFVEVVEVVLVVVYVNKEYWVGVVCVGFGIGGVFFDVFEVVGFEGYVFGKLRGVEVGGLFDVIDQVVVGVVCCCEDDVGVVFMYVGGDFFGFVGVVLGFGGVVYVL